MRQLDDGTTVHTFRRSYTNAHVVVKGDAAFMVDAGEEHDAPALAADLRKAGIDPAKLRAIVLTHGHADHAGGAGWFQREFGTKIVVGAGDVPLLEAGHNDRLCPTDATGRRRLRIYQNARYTPERADVVVADELALADVAGVPGRIVALSGHTAGSQVVVLDDAVLVGDLFRGGLLAPTAHMHFYMCDPAGNRRQVRRLADELAPGARIFFTGHFGPVKRRAVLRRFGP